MTPATEDAITVSVVIPCLNEADTLEACIVKAKEGLSASGETGEIIIADNGSTDRSLEVASNLGVRVVQVPERGYGSALMGGIEGLDDHFGRELHSRAPLAQSAIQLTSKPAQSTIDVVDFRVKPPVPDGGEHRVTPPVMQKRHGTRLVKARLCEVPITLFSFFVSLLGLRRK